MNVQQNNFRHVMLDTLHRKSMSIRRLAEITGVNHSQISRPINGKSTVKRETLIRWCKALGCSPQETAEIFATTDYRAPSPEELEEEVGSRAA